MTISNRIGNRWKVGRSRRCFLPQFPCGNGVIPNGTKGVTLCCARMRSDPKFQFSLLGLFRPRTSAHTMVDKSKKKGSVAAPAATKEAPPAKKRAVRRCLFVASAEVTELSSETRLSARTSELGLGGCYIETLNPFTEGTVVQLRIVRDQGVFESKAKVVYSHGNFGMGLAFTDMAPKQRSVLEDWLAEIVIQSRPAS